MSEPFASADQVEDRHPYFSAAEAAREFMQEQGRRSRCIRCGNPAQEQIRRDDGTEQGAIEPYCHPCGWAMMRHLAQVSAGEQNQLAAATRDARTRVELPPGVQRPTPEGEPARELLEFLAEPDPEYDWLIPEVLERGDRLILTGPEGGGKSTLLRQLGVQIASGIHPFTLEKIDPVRVLVLDLENSPRQVRRSLRPLRLAAGTGYQIGNLHVVVEPAGMDLFGHVADRDWLAQRVEAVQAEVLIAGPLYKLAAGDPTLEEVARTVAAALDRLRADHQLTVILEAHTPHAANGLRRPTRPYGASLWLRWPEFGKHLDPAGRLADWRGPRDERTWPRSLKRGGAWPWTVPDADTAADEELASLPDNAVKVLAILRGSPGDPLTVKQIVDGIRRQIGKPITRQAVQRHLQLLQDYGFADSVDLGRGKPKRWHMLTPKEVQQGATNVQP